MTPREISTSAVQRLVLEVRKDLEEIEKLASQIESASGPRGLPSAGLSGGASGRGRSAATLYQLCIISFSERVIR